MKDQQSFNKNMSTWGNGNKERDVVEESKSGEMVLAIKAIG